MTFLYCYTMTLSYCSDNNHNILDFYINNWYIMFVNFGPLAQLARAPALQAGGQGFESLTVHNAKVAQW